MFNFSSSDCVSKKKAIQIFNANLQFDIDDWIN